MANIAIYEVNGEGRAAALGNPLMTVPSPENSPPPQVGDILNLPASATGDEPERAFIHDGASTPFRVLEREFSYVDRGGKGDAISTPSIWLFVERITRDEYGEEPHNPSRRGREG